MLPFRMGANPKKTNSRGRTAYELAVDANSLAAAKILADI